MKNGFLDQVYGVSGTDGTKQLYQDWAASYDAEVRENGYATPGRCAVALAQFAALDTPVLDFGCGTGLSGLALKLAGFGTIDGLDLSEEMLLRAREKGVYRGLRAVPGDAPPPIDKGSYAAIAAIGVIGAGAAPIDVLDDLMHALGPGGLCVFSFNDHALSDPTHEARVMEWTDCGAATLLFREYGPHLPGIDLKSNVYVLERK